MQSAVEYFELAIEQDPGYSAWVGLADALTLLYDYHIDRRDVLMVRAGEAVQRAELDPLSAEAHACGGSSVRKAGWSRAILALTRAVELKPNYADAQSWLAWVQQVQGDAAEVSKAPVEGSPSIRFPERPSVSDTFAPGRRYDDKALAQSLHNQTVLPSWPTARFYEGLALYHLGRYQEVQERLEGISVDWTDFGAEALLALSYVASGDHGQAREILATIQNADDPFSTGLVYAALGEAELAFTEFEKIERWNAWPPLAMRIFSLILGPLAQTTRYQLLFETMREDWGY